MSDPVPRRGRPHDAEGAREAILNAAEAVFAEHGFDGARIDAIAAAARYNKSLIFQYFGDKLNLYAEVIRRADEQTRELQTKALGALLEDGTSLGVDRLKAVLREFGGAYFDYLAAHPRITRIYLWELAEGWQTYAKIVTEHDYEDVEVFTPILRDLQKAGVLRADVDPLVQITVALFMSMFYLGLVPMYQTFFPDADTASPEGLARGREFVIDFVVRGLIPDPGDRKPNEEADRDTGNTI